MMTFTFLRHGESEGNKARVLQGQENYPLSELGRRQIHSLADHWQRRGVTFDEIISSPLLRALSSAEILSTSLSLPLRLDPLWVERNHGEAQGLSYEEVERLRRSNPPPSPFEPLFESGESEWDLFRRAAEAVQSLVHLPGGTYLVVSHGGILSAAIRVALGAAPDAGRQPPVRIAHANAGYSRLSYDVERARWTIHAVNVNCHLREEGEEA